MVRKYKKKAGCHVGPGIILCTTDNSKARKRESKRVLKTSGRGDIRITGSDVHLLQVILNCIKDSPDCISLYGEDNPCVVDMMKRVNAQVCEACGGQGWWMCNMGEDADACPECKGTGAKVRRRKKTS